MAENVNITIDGRELSVSADKTIFQAATEAGLMIPHFCYHPKLSIAGNCRLCQVEVEGARGPVISCRERVREGMVVRVHSDKSQQVRKDVLEFILINHPLDCPICDQSGECKLQDQYFAHSLQPSRMHDVKVHKPKAKQIGPQVMLDDERCVMCTRCVRFCDEVVGEHQIFMRERGDHSTIDVYPGKQLDNAYSLCTVDICPVGALTSKDFRFKKRVWFLENTKSICTGCSTGCNIWADSSDRILYRYRPRDNEAVNQCWMCDAGRMTYKTLNADARLLFPHVKTGHDYQPASVDRVLAQAAAQLQEIGFNDVVGVLSAQASVEENMALAALLRTWAGGAPKLCWTGEPQDGSFADKLLRDADRNPNTKGAQLLASKRFDRDVQAKALIVLDGLHGDDLLALSAIKPQLVIVITHRAPDAQRYADILLPRATHLEQEGTFINRTNRLQRFTQGFAPHGDAQPAWMWSARLLEALGQKSTLPHDAAQVFEQEKAHCAALANIRFVDIPDDGVQL